ncbi:hypothetical protein [Streptomyces luteireticuli]|uniref:hypothetical protein n=1 Tax=Streptomyces luteireticuli TaxID=173858 RepID=UPI003555D45C
MSHFSLLVALPPTSPDKVEAVLDDVLAPFGADTVVAAYRDYERGTPRTTGSSRRAGRMANCPQRDP